MDTTPEYIKQCGKATADLHDYYLENHSSLRPLFIYDFATERVSMLMWVPNVLRKKLGIKENSIIVSIESDKDRGMWIQEGTRESDKPVVILWRQDQLQEIWREGEAGLAVGEVKLLIEWMYQNKSYVFDFDTHEQLWLAFVMKEKYGKVWNGEEWVEEAGNAKT